MDAISILKGLLPIGGELLGGPVGAIILGKLADKIGVPKDNVQAIADAVQGIDPLKRQELENEMIRWHVEEADKMTMAYLADVQNARGRDVELRKAGQHNYRADAIVAMTWIGIVICISLAVSMTSLNEFAKTAITTLLGVLVGDWKSITSFEFGSTKSSKDKDETISNLSKG